GLANIEIKRGKAQIPTAGHPEQSEAKSRDREEVTDKLAQQDPSVRAGLADSLGMTDLEESIFVFVKTPDQISHVAKGGGTGAKSAWKRAGRFNQWRAFNYSERCAGDERSECCGKPSHAFCR